MKITNDNHMEKSYDVYSVEKEACCFFYDAYLQPRITEEELSREETADGLIEFLERMNLNFDEFMSYIRYYSLGHGLDYLQEIYDVRSFRENGDDNDSDDNYMDF